MASSRPATRVQKTVDRGPVFHSVMHREYILLQQGHGGVFVFSGLSTPAPPQDRQASEVNVPSESLSMGDDHDDHHDHDNGTCGAIGAYGTGPSIGIYMQISETECFCANLTLDPSEHSAFGITITTQDITTATRRKLQSYLMKTPPHAKYHPTLFMVCCEPDRTSYAMRDGVMQWARLDYLLKPEELGGPLEEEHKAPASLLDREEIQAELTRQKKRRAEYEHFLRVGPTGFIVEQPGLRRDVVLLNETQCSSVTNWMPRGVIVGGERGGGRGRGRGGEKGEKDADEDGRCGASFGGRREWVIRVQDRETMGDIVGGG